MGTFGNLNVTNMEIKFQKNVSWKSGNVNMKNIYEAYTANRSLFHTCGLEDAIGCTY